MFEKVIVRSKFLIIDIANALDDRYSFIFSFLFCNFLINFVLFIRLFSFYISENLAAAIATMFCKEHI